MGFFQFIKWTNRKIYDIPQIKDSKEKRKWQEKKELVALDKPKKELSKEEKENVEMFLKLAGLDKEV